jgi:hypothetical protein
MYSHRKNNSNNLSTNESLLPNSLLSSFYNTTL